MSEFVALPSNLQTTSALSFFGGQTCPLLVLPSSGGGTTIVNTIVNVLPSITFIFRGFYVAGGVYEVWSGTTRNALPPSGHSLSDITVVGELPQAGTY